MYFFTLPKKCIPKIASSQPQLQHCPCGDMSDAVSIIIAWLYFLAHKPTKIIIVLSFAQRFLHVGSVKKSPLSSLAEVHVY